MRRTLLAAALFAALAALAAPALAEAPRVVLFFSSWSAKLDSAATRSIQGAADWAKQHPAATLTVTGHASTIGSAAANEDLSLLRAQIVSDELAADGVPPARIRRHSLGATDYVMDPEEARRVVITLGGP